MTDRPTDAPEGPRSAKSAMQACIPETERGQLPAERSGRLRTLANVIGALWIGGGMLFFFIRFSSVFLHANRAALQRFFEQP